MCIYTCVYIYIHICIDAYICVYIYIYIYTLLLLLLLLRRQCGEGLVQRLAPSRAHPGLQHLFICVYLVVVILCSALFITCLFCCSVIFVTGLQHLALRARGDRGERRAHDGAALGQGGEVLRMYICVHPGRGCKS